MLKKTPDLEIVYELRGEVEIIERIIEDKVPKRETIYILDSTKKVIDSYNSYNVQKWNMISCKYNFFSNL